MKRLLPLLLVLLTVSTAANARLVKVLAIGNSFSQDAVEQYLYELAAAKGDSLVIGNAYIGGCSIDRHVNNLRNDIADYEYRKIVGGVRTNTTGVNLKTIIQNEPWDIITLQQASPNSGKEDTYSNLPELKQRVVALATNKDVHIVWHLTWAYSANYKSQNFLNYNNNRLTMYLDIMRTAQKILPATGIEGCIPTGVAIQEAYGYFGDRLYRDGYHLSYLHGRFAAACVWYECILGRNVRNNSYVPEGISKCEARKLKRIVHEAVSGDNDL